MSISGAADRYELKPYKMISYVDMLSYWCKLINTRYIRCRLFNTSNPSVHDVVEMHCSSGNQCFYIVDKEDGNRIVAEAMLNNCRNLCAQVHFSIDPDRFGKDALVIANSGIRDLFELTDPRTDKTIKSLIAIVPVSNRLIIGFQKKLNFKMLDILPQIYYNKDNNKYTDGQLSILKKEAFYGGQE